MDTRRRMVAGGLAAAGPGERLQRDHAEQAEPFKELG
jgi:hypothetical protein